MMNKLIKPLTSELKLLNKFNRLKQTLIFSLGFSLIIIGCSDFEEVIFGVCTDVHPDIMHDATWRMGEFISEMNELKPDFIIQLGDFCQPIESNMEFLSTWESFEGPEYHVLGNHDMDVNIKQVFMEFTGMEKPYYSFDINSVHFIVLDANFYTDSTGYIDYSNGNYYSHGATRCNIPPDQLNWLKQDLDKTELPTVVFSHQGFLEEGACLNKEEVRRIFEESGKVKAAFSGHSHSDFASEINGIHYVMINSMSNHWVGSEYQCPGRYSEEINAFRPSLKYTAPFTDPLYATITVKKDKIIIEGIESSYVPPTPSELGIPEKLYGLELSPRISDRILKFQPGP
jgi:predicted phosphodiesterase